MQEARCLLLYPRGLPSIGLDIGSAVGTIPHRPVPTLQHVLVVALTCWDSF
jgi:hypothetical protein